MSPGNPPLRERERDRLRERDERLASRTAADPDDLRRAPRRKAPDALQLEVEARRASSRRGRRAADVLHAAVGKLVEETKRQVALGGGHPPELALGKADLVRDERGVEHRVANGDGEEGADLRLLPLSPPPLSSSASSSSASAKNHALAQALLQKAAFPERTAQSRQKSLKQYEHSWMSARSNIWSHRSQKM